MKILSMLGAMASMFSKDTINAKFNFKRSWFKNTYGTSKYKPHQGMQERERRCTQPLAGATHFHCSCASRAY